MMIIKLPGRNDDNVSWSWCWCCHRWIAAMVMMLMTLDSYNDK